MNRKEIYALINKLGLKETITCEFKRNWTQISNVQLEQFLKSYMNPKVDPKVKAEIKAVIEKSEDSKEKVGGEKVGGDKLERLIEILVKKRILLPSEVKYIG